MIGQSFRRGAGRNRNVCRPPRTDLRCRMRWKMIRDSEGAGVGADVWREDEG